MRLGQCDPTSFVELCQGLHHEVEVSDPALAAVGAERARLRFDAASSGPRGRIECSMSRAASPQQLPLFNGTADDGIEHLIVGSATDGAGRPRSWPCTTSSSRRVVEHQQPHLHAERQLDLAIARI
jgi:hypothetical protein